MDNLDDVWMTWMDDLKLWMSWMSRLTWNDVWMTVMAHLIRIGAAHKAKWAAVAGEQSKYQYSFLSAFKVAEEENRLKPPYNDMRLFQEAWRQ